MGRHREEGADAWNGAGYAIDEYEESDESTVAEESESEALSEPESLLESLPETEPEEEGDREGEDESE